MLRHDVHARDVRGNTPLHTLANDPVHRRKLFEKFVRGGAAVFATNLACETVFDVAFQSGLEAKEVAFYLQQGYRLNTFNIVNVTGFLAAALMSSAGISQGVSDSIFQFLFVHVDEMKSVDDAGRTCIHNIVSTRLPRERDRAFHRYDTHTDDLLRSAHKEYDLDLPKLSRLKEPVAFECLYRYWIRKLVHLGCDVSAQDNTGKTALHMAARFQNYCAVNALLWTGADMNLVDAEGKTAFEYALRAYRRESSDEYENEDRCALLMLDYLQKMIGMLKMQFNKIIRRAALMQSARSALHVLSGMPLAELVCEELARYLSYYDIKNVIASAE